MRLVPSRIFECLGHFASSVRIGEQRPRLPTTGE